MHIIYIQSTLYIYWNILEYDNNKNENTVYKPDPKNEIHIQAMVLHLIAYLYDKIHPHHKNWLTATLDKIAVYKPS